jgi:CelD/BcsL family acetyltransferase involved in cellulose biosynthesis
MSDLSAAPEIALDPVHALAPLEVDIHHSLQSAEAIWRELERHSVLTPYQRFDWIAGLLAAGAEPRGTIAIAVIRRGDQAIALLPLLLERHRGAMRARFLGAHQSNSDWLVLRSGFELDAKELQDIFAKLARQAGGIDLISLQNQPAAWSGVSNSLLLLPHAPAPSNLYTLGFAGVAAPYIEHGLNKKRRANINRDRRRLEELMGPLKLVHVRDTDMLKRTHMVFLEQRGVRFAEMGIDNIFAQKPFPEFFLRLCEGEFGKPRPALCAHALLAGDEILATAWGAMAGNHYAQYINSTTAGPASQYSLINQLIAPLMDELIQAGITSFDLGLGDFEYKTKWCTAEPTFNSHIALSARGRLVAGLDSKITAAKRLIKQTPALWQAAQNLRRVLFRLQRQS